MSSDAPEQATSPGFLVRQWRAHWNVVALIGAVTFFFFPVVLGKIVFHRDPAHWNFPLMSFLRDTWLGGGLPGWDPRQGLGFPAVADPQLGAFYPPNALFLLPGTARLVTIDHLLHMVWGGVGIMVLLRRLHVGATAQLVGGLAWSLSGLTVGLFTTGSMPQSMAWIPWAGVAGSVLAQTTMNAPAVKPWLRGALLASLPTAMALLSGEVFVATMGVLFGLMLAVVLVWRDHDQLKVPLLRLTGLGAITMSIAATLSSANLIPVALGAGSTGRSGALPLSEAEVWSLHPLRLVEMVAPGSMGRPLTSYVGAHFIGDPLGEGPVFSLGVCLGAGVLLFACLGISRRKLPLALLLGAGFALLIAMGKHLPVHLWFRHLVPPLSHMRYPEKYLVLVLAPVALLAGMGAEQVLKSSRRWWKRHLVWAAMLAALAPAISCFRRPCRPLSWAVPCTAWRRFCCWPALCTCAPQPTASRQSPWLFWSHWMSVCRFCLRKTFNRAICPTVNRRRWLSSMRSTNPKHIGYPFAFTRDPRVDQSTAKYVPIRTPDEYESKYLLTLISNTMNVFGLANVKGYSPAVPRSWRTLWQSAPSRAAALRFSATEFTVLRSSVPMHPLPIPHWLKPGSIRWPGARLYRVKDPLPRVYWTGHTRIRKDDGDYFAADVLEGRAALVEPSGEAPELQGSGNGTCQLTEHSNNRIAADCTVPGAAMAVFVEQFAPGWGATVDGSSADILLVNGVMRGVQLNAGTHKIVMQYTPPGLYAGIALSLLGLVFAVAGLLWTRPRATA